MRTRAGAERGAALLVAIVSIAVLTSVAVSLAYESRVALRIAANARDGLRASYLARSGVTISRLVLEFQREVDDLAQPVAGMAVPRLHLWRLLPVGSELVQTLFPAPGAPAGRAAAESGFEAAIEDEGRKVNAQLDMTQGGASGPMAAARVQALYQLICDARWDPLFEREDARGVRTSREELLVHLTDGVDGNEGTSELNARFGSASCGTAVLPPPFKEGFGDENQPYDRGEDRYKAKNARMDSLDELFLVAGVGDPFMAAFGDALTVYLPRDGPGSKQTVNGLDREGLVLLAKLVADPPALLQPVLLEPAFGERLQQLMVERTLNGLLALDTEQIGQIITEAGVTVNAQLLAKTNQNSAFTDRSTTFRVRATGRAGDVATTIDAVVRTVKPATGAPVAAPGKLVHWKEE